MNATADLLWILLAPRVRPNSGEFQWYGRVPGREGLEALRAPSDSTPPVSGVFGRNPAPGVLGLVSSGETAFSAVRQAPRRMGRAVLFVPGGKQDTSRYRF